MDEYALGVGFRSRPNATGMRRLSPRVAPQLSCIDTAVRAIGSGIAHIERANDAGGNRVHLGGEDPA